MKYIHVTAYTVTIKDNNNRRIYYKVTNSSIDRAHRVLAGCPKSVNTRIFYNDTVYAISDNPVVMAALYLQCEIKTRKLDKLTKGDMLFLKHMAFEVIKVNPKNIQLRRVAMKAWPTPENMYQRFTSYTRNELLANAHPMTRQETAQLIMANRLVLKGQG